MARRIRLAIGGTAPLLGPLASIALASLAIRRASLQLWGAVVDELLIVGFATQVTAWGLREPTLRAMMVEPARRAEILGHCLATRLPLLLAVGLMLLALRGPTSGCAWTVLWIGSAFVHQAFGPLVAATRRNSAGAIAELAGFGLTAALLLLPASHDADLLLRALATGALLRAVMLAAQFPGALQREHLRPEWSQLRAATPFVAVGLLGYLHTRTGLVVASRLLDARALAEYQLVSGLLFWGQAVGLSLVQPFVQGLYRAPAAPRARLAVRLRWLSLLLAAGPALAVAGVAHLAYGISLPASAIGAVWLGCLAVFAAQPDIYLLFRERREGLVASISGLCSIVQAGLTVWLLRDAPWTAALTASALGQLVLAGCCWAAARQRASVASQSVRPDPSA